METAPAGRYDAIVVQLARAQDGEWAIAVDGTLDSALFWLAPVRLIIRFAQLEGSDVIRGSVRRVGDDYEAPFQCNARLVRLLRACLASAEDASDEQ